MFLKDMAEEIRQLKRGGAQMLYLAFADDISYTVCFRLNAYTGTFPFLVTKDIDDNFTT